MRAPRACARNRAFSVKLPGMKSLLVALRLALVGATGEASNLDPHADKLASLINSAKLATFGKRGAHPRIQKAVAILAGAESEKLDPAWSARRRFNVLR